jgi:hypothetical protein
MASSRRYAGIHLKAGRCSNCTLTVSLQRLSHSPVTVAPEYVKRKLGRDGVKKVAIQFANNAIARGPKKTYCRTKIRCR